MARSTNSTETPANRASRRRALVTPPKPIKILDLAQRLGLQAALTNLATARKQLAEVEEAVSQVFHAVGLDPTRDYPMNSQTGEVYEPGTVLDK